MRFYGGSQMSLPQQNLRLHETDLPQNKLNSLQNKLFLKLGMMERGIFKNGNIVCSDIDQ